MTTDFPNPDGADPILAAVGRCLYGWSSVERSLASLFVALHDQSCVPEPKHLQAAFDAVSSFEVRLAMVNASVRHDERNAGVFSEKWNALYNKLTRAARKRAQVAHFSIVVHNATGRDGIRRSTHKVHPFWTLTDMFTFSDGPIAPLTREQLCVRAESFGRLAGRVMRFCRYVWIARGTPLTGDAPIPDPARLLEAQFDPTPTTPQSPPEPSSA